MLRGEFIVERVVNESWNSKSTGNGVKWLRVGQVGWGWLAVRGFNVGESGWIKYFESTAVWDIMVGHANVFQRAGWGSEFWIALTEFVENKVCGGKRGD